MSDRPDIAIIGPGKVGTAVGILAGRAGYRVVAVAGRTPESATDAAKLIGNDAKSCAAVEAASAGGLVLLTVPDDVIANVAAELAEAGAFAPDSIVAHCSGALSSEVLAPVRDRCRCHVASMHPLQTFPTIEAAAEKLGGACFFCEGDGPAVRVVRQLATDIGGKAVRIHPAAKALYHAAAVMACNHLTAGLDAALALAEAAGIDRATYLEACMPMVQATVKNVAALGPAGALTGPVARGDVETVRKHLEALQETPVDLRRFFVAAVTWTVDLALRKGSIDGKTADALRKMLHNE